MHVAPRSSGAAQAVGLSYEELARRNAELEETLAAIRHLQVDAPVVDAGEEPRVLAFSGSDAIYRLIVEEMPAGAATVDEHGAILTANLAMATIFSTPLEELMGRRLDELVRRGSVEPLRGALAEGGRLTVEPLTSVDAAAQVSIRLIDGSEAPLRCVIVTDVTDQRRANRRLQAQAELIDLAHEAILVRDPAGAIAFWNRGAEEMYGWGAEEAVGRNTADLFDGVSADSAAGIDDALLSTGRWAGDVENRRANGSSVLAHVRMSLRRGFGRRPDAVIELHTDMTDRARLEQAAERRASLLDEIDAAVVATDDRGAVIEWSAGATRLLGWSREEIIGSLMADLVLRAPNAPDGVEIMAAVRETGAWEGHFEASRRDGGTVPIQLHLTRMPAGRLGAGGFVGVAVDVSAELAQTNALRAARDHLRAITDSMAEGLYATDADGRLTEMNRAAEDLLGWGREELKGKSMHEMTHARRADGSPFLAEECPMTGIRHGGPPVRVDDDVFVRRDQSLLPVAYAATGFGSDASIGTVVVFRDITVEKLKEARLKNDLEALGQLRTARKALEEERLVLFAQPIVDVATGEVVQRELLLRMRAEDGSMIGPGAFLPAAEKYGLIREIDRWVVSAATDIAARVGRVQFNISALSLANTEILNLLASQAKLKGVPPANVVIEVTETALVDTDEAALRFAARVRELGFAFALDDFGTGYGGFSYLKHIPLDQLKIDVDFVHDLATDPASQHVVKAVCALAAGLGLRTVAEGVDDPAIMPLLREYGVDLAQGFALGRPAPCEPVEEGHE